MFKWVIGLCAAMYVTLLVFGAPPEGEAVAAVPQQVEPAEPVVEVATRATVEQIKPAALVEKVSVATLEATPNELVAKVVDTIAKEDAIAPAVQVAATAEPQAAIEAVIKTEPELDEALIALKERGIGEIWRVTGSTVNLRAAATTQSDVLGRTRRGDSAEVIELLDNGWARVYILENGQEAYMSAKFLKRETQ